MPPDAARSRTGCATCKARKKKCDEQFAVLGDGMSCRRCHLGSFECAPGQSVKHVRHKKERLDAPGASLVASTSRVRIGDLPTAATPVVGAGGRRGGDGGDEGTASPSAGRLGVGSPSAEPSPLSQAALDQFLAELNASPALDEAGTFDSFGRSWASLEQPLAPVDNSHWHTSDTGFDSAPVDLGSKHQFCKSSEPPTITTRACHR